MKVYEWTFTVMGMCIFLGRTPQDHISAGCQVLQTVDSTKSMVHHPGLSYLANCSTQGKYELTGIYALVARFDAFV